MDLGPTIPFFSSFTTGDQHCHQRRVCKLRRERRNPNKLRHLHLSRQTMRGCVPPAPLTVGDQGPGADQGLR